MTLEELQRRHINQLLADVATVLEDNTHPMDEYCRGIDLSQPITI